MKFEIAFTRTAAEHVRSYRKYEQKIILDAVDDQLAQEPAGALGILRDAEFRDVAWLPKREVRGRRGKAGQDGRGESGVA